MHLLLALTVACGGHSRGQPSQNDGGSASTAGSGSTSSTGSTATEPSANEQPRGPCVYESVAMRCEPGACPSDPSWFDAECARGSIRGRQAATACGGSVVNVSFGYGETSWYFDGSGTLVGVKSSGDVSKTCPDGHESWSSVYGATCEPAVPWLDLCPPMPPIDECNVAPLTCEGAPICNESLDGTVMDTCNDPVALSVTSSRTTCGGTLIAVDRGNGTVRYCFDARDVLVGMSSTASANGSVDLKGSNCSPEGAVELACPGNPG
jgi:hypothetical protein